MRLNIDQPTCRMLGETDGTNYVVVAQCPNGTGESSVVVGVLNRDTAARNISFWFNDGSGVRTEIARVTALAAGSHVTTATFYPWGIYIRGPEFIEVTVDAVTTNDCTFFTVSATTRFE